jgi:hypothetical protein
VYLYQGRTWRGLIFAPLLWDGLRKFGAYKYGDVKKLPYAECNVEF